MTVLEIENRYMDARTMGRPRNVLVFFLVLIGVMVALTFAGDGFVDAATTTALPNVSRWQYTDDILYVHDVWETDIVTTVHLPESCSEWGQPWVSLQDIMDDSIVSPKASVSGANVLAVVFPGAQEGSYLNATAYVPCLD